MPEMTEQAPKGLLLATDRRKWAEERLDEMEAAQVEALQAALDRGGLVGLVDRHCCASAGVAG